MSNLNQVYLAQKSLLPVDFDYLKYLEYNPDLTENGINSENLAQKHYILYGIKEKRQYKQTKLVPVIDQEFDSVFYASEYPDVRSYYIGVKNISLEERLYHHYINYGKNEGRFQNHNEKTQAIENCKQPVSQHITENDLVCPVNELRCVCLLTTDKEIKTKQYDKFINRLIQNTSKNEYTTQIDFKIIVNNNNYIPKIRHLQKLFANVEVVYLNIAKTEDIYQSSLSAKQSIPEYGLKSGPNIMFFETIKRHVNYNTILLLETDCLLSLDWLTNLYMYTKYANGFLISGATYDGNTFTKAGSPMMNHINGGTALYATYHPVLQAIVDMCADFIKQQVQNKMNGLAYDYAIKLLIDSGLDGSIDSRPDRRIWQFINRNYLPCKLIINCSTINDLILEANKVYTQYKYSVLHQKDNL